MKAILIDDIQHVKIITLNPTDRIDVVDQFIPCGGCGRVVLFEYSVNGNCFKCFAPNETREQLELLGWTWEHPGYWRKQFDRFTIVAGTGEYRFDFWLGGSADSHGYGADWCFDVKDWHSKQQELTERGFLNPAEHEELELVYEYLYLTMQQDQTHTRGNWEAEYGSLGAPNGMEMQHESGNRPRITLDKEQLFGLTDDEEMSVAQSDTFCTIAAILMAVCAEEID
jgi:hypothetical protein